MAKDNPTTIPEPVTRNTTGLRNALFDEIDAVRRGYSDAKRANAMSKLGSTIIESVRMELEVRKFMQGSARDNGGNLPVLGSPIELGE